ncbi:MAG: type II secretion system F family protein [Planctomycetota bacterium]|nr:type II secretion system F family protein [Planctomycetota bacterium]
MPVYSYKAFNSGGQIKTGIEDADSPREARLRLRRQGLHVTDISELEAVGEKSQSRLQQWRSRRKTASYLPQITRQLATLLRSGIPLNDALKALIEQVETRRLEVVLRDVRERISSGSSFAEALELHPGVFPQLFVSMVRAGEAAGNNDVVLTRLAEFLMRQSRMKNRVISALMYPIIMLLVGSVVVTILMIKVVPQLIALVEAKQQQLPTPTQILKETTNFLSSYWILLAVGAVVIGMVISAIRRTPNGKFATDKMILGLPIVGDLFKKQAISRFAVTLATLLKTGVPILEAIKIVRDVVGNAVLQRVLDDLHSAILKGADISTPLKRSGIFPPAVGYMIAVGEQSGELEEILDSLAESYDLEVEIATDRMTAALEPIMIIIMAGAVAFIVMAIVLPMLALGSS